MTTTISQESNLSACCQQSDQKKTQLKAKMSQKCSFGEKGFQDVVAREHLAKDKMSKEHAAADVALDTGKKDIPNLTAQMQALNQDLSIVKVSRLVEIDGDDLN